MANTYNNTFNDFSKQIQGAIGSIPTQTPSIDFSGLEAKLSRTYDPEKELGRSQLGQMQEQVKLQQRGIYGKLGERMDLNVLGAAGTAAMQPFKIKATAMLSKKDEDNVLKEDASKQLNINRIMKNMAEDQMGKYQRAFNALSNDTVRTINELVKDESIKILWNQKKEKEKIAANFERSRQKLEKTTGRFTTAKNVISGISGTISGIIAGILTQGQAAGAGYKVGKAAGGFWFDVFGGKRYQRELESSMYV